MEACLDNFKLVFDGNNSRERAVQKFLATYLTFTDVSTDGPAEKKILEALFLRCL
jgi:hypothetical protein